MLFKFFKKSQRVELLHERRIGNPSYTEARRWRYARLRLEELEDRVVPSASLEAYGQLPLSFEANQGQTAPQVDFLSRGNGYALFLTPSQAVLTLQKPAAPDTGGLAAP